MAIAPTIVPIRCQAFLFPSVLDKYGILKLSIRNAPIAEDVAAVISPLIKHQPAGIGSRETKHLHKYNQTKRKQKLTSDVIHHVTNSTGKALEEWRSRVQT